MYLTNGKNVAIKRYSTVADRDVYPKGQSDPGNWSSTVEARNATAWANFFRSSRNYRVIQRPLCTCSRRRLFRGSMYIATNTYSLT